MLKIERIVIFILLILIVGSIFGFVDSVTNRSEADRISYGEFNTLCGFSDTPTESVMAFTADHTNENTRVVAYDVYYGERYFGQVIFTYPTNPETGEVSGKALVSCQ